MTILRYLLCEIKLRADKKYRKNIILQYLVRYTKELTKLITEGSTSMPSNSYRTQFSYTWTFVFAPHPSSPAKIFVIANKFRKSERIAQLPVVSNWIYEVLKRRTIPHCSISTRARDLIFLFTNAGLFDNSIFTYRTMDRYILLRIMIDTDLPFQ